MGLPDRSVTLSVEQISDLNRKLSEMRHDINNYLSVIIPAAELTRLKPETADQMLPPLLLQIPKITEAVKAFSADFERVLGITKP